MKRNALLAALAVAILTPVALAADAATPTERVRLQPLGASPERATAVVGPHGRGTRVTVDVSKAPPHALVRAVLNAGTCRKRSTSFASAGSARSDGAGRARWNGPILFHYGQVDWDTIARGDHVLVLIIDGKTAACGAIPGMS